MAMSLVKITVVGVLGDVVGVLGDALGASHGLTSVL